MSSALTSSSSKTANPSPVEEHMLSCFTDTHGVITSTMNDLPGYKIVKVLGTIYGISVRSRNLFVDIKAGLRSVVGGEIKYITSLMYTSRNAAVERLVGECMARGGNAIIALRFDQGEVNTFAQVCAYGTAIVVEEIDSGKTDMADGPSAS